MHHRPKIILFGDSITQLSFSAKNKGFGAEVCDYFQRRADVLNRGFSGYNTDWALRLLDDSSNHKEQRSDIFGGDAKHVKLVSVFFGANDASDEVSNSRQHVPLERYKANLKRIVSIVKEECGQDVKIFIICPPPICHEARLKFQVERYGDKATGILERTLELSGKYATAASEVALELSIPCLNLWQDMCAEGEEKWQTFLCDGLHLSEAGNIFVGEKIISLIKDKFPDIAITPCPYTGHYGTSGSTSNLKQIAPWHDELQPSHKE